MVVVQSKSLSHYKIINKIMAEKVVKSLFEVTFKSIRDKFNTAALNVVAIDFAEALKKADAIADQAKKDKDDIVELVKIERKVSIDSE